jgi:hypothetical protein
MNGNQQLRGAVIVGGVLSALAVVLFFVIYVLMQNAGVEPLPRLLASLCAPPGILAVGVGAYALFRRR